MLSFLLKLLLAHILGDFLLQPNSWGQARNKKKLPSKYLYYHLAVHAIILSIVLAFDIDYTLGFLVIILSHFSIDMLKVYFNKFLGRYWFFISS